MNEEQKHWSEHLYPYKIAEYEHTLLTEPTIIGHLNYYNGINDSVGCTADTIDRNVITKTKTAFTTNGQCDGVIIWVDYDVDLEGTKSIQYYHKNHKDTIQNIQFMHHAKVSVKFFETSMNIVKTVTTAPVLHVETGFEYGASDFSNGFTVLP